MASHHPVPRNSSVNDAAASVRLALSGYYQVAFLLVRDILEVGFLLDFFRTSPGKNLRMEGGGSTGADEKLSADSDPRCARPARRLRGEEAGDCLQTAVQLRGSCNVSRLPYHHEGWARRGWTLL